MEGMSPEVLLAALKNAGATIEGESMAQENDQITKQDFVEFGLSGGLNASERRKRLENRLHLPEHMSANALLQALNLLLSREELGEIVREWDNENGETHG